MTFDSRRTGLTHARAVCFAASLAVALLLGCNDTAAPDVEPQALFEVEIVEAGSGERHGFVIEPGGDVFTYMVGITAELPFEEPISIAVVRARHRTSRRRIGALPPAVVEERIATLANMSATTFSHLTGCSESAAVWYVGYQSLGTEYRRVLLRSDGAFRNVPPAGSSAAVLSEWLASIPLITIPKVC